MTFHTSPSGLGKWIMSVAILKERRRARLIAARLEAKMPRELAALVAGYLGPADEDAYKIMLQYPIHMGRIYSSRDLRGNRFYLRCDADVESVRQEKYSNGPFLLLNNLDAATVNALDRIRYHTQTLIPRCKVSCPLKLVKGQATLPVRPDQVLKPGRYRLLLDVWRVVLSLQGGISYRIILVQSALLGQIEAQDVPLDSDDFMLCAL